jgi:hypothetical protein
MEDFPPLSQDRPLGVYAERDGYARIEFQQGRRLIWVLRRTDEAEPDCLRRADAMVAAAYDAVPAVVSVAEARSRSDLVDFWAAHDGSGVPGERLDVWGVTLKPDDGAMSFDVGLNHDFDFAGLPEFPDDLFYLVNRAANGELKVAD